MSFVMLQMHPALNLAPSCVYVYIPIILITFVFATKFFPRFSSNPFELIGLPILAWFIYHINARHGIQILNFLIFPLVSWLVHPSIHLNA